MSSSASSTTPSAQSSGGSWASINPYFTPPFAASTAIVPTFYGFVVKTAQQLGEQAPKMTLKEALKGGLKAAPTIGAIVGTQMIMQRIVEKALAKDKGSENFLSILGGSMVVGGVSAPALAIFNGQTMGRSALESLKSLSVKQTSAIVTRETSFLFSLRISDPMGHMMRQIAGDNKIVDYVSAFTSGAIGSVIGHPADTALTLWQKNIQVVSWQQLMRGAPAKALAVGGFSVFYKLVKEILE